MLNRIKSHFTNKREHNNFPLKTRKIPRCSNQFKLRTFFITADFIHLTFYKNTNPSHMNETPRLFLSKTFRLFDSVVKFLDQLIVALVRWQVQPVEARVRPR